EQLNKALLDLQRMADITDSFKAARELIETLIAVKNETWVREQKKADIDADIEERTQYQQQNHDETKRQAEDLQEDPARVVELKVEMMDDMEKVKAERDDQTKLSAELEAEMQTEIDDLKTQKLEAENSLAVAKKNIEVYLKNPTA